MTTLTTKPIHQSVRFPATARQLYDLYMNPKKHSAFSGAKVTISARTGSPFRAFDGQLSGVILFTIPGKLIVQRWRSTQFYKTDPDSILILAFAQDGQQGRIDLTHVNVPPQDNAGVIRGWRQYYWTPMRAYLKNNPNSK